MEKLFLLETEEVQGECFHINYSLIKAMTIEEADKKAQQYLSTYYGIYNGDTVYNKYTRLYEEGHCGHRSIGRTRISELPANKDQLIDELMSVIGLI